jgi:membrane protein DedA with SNARE-associated domain
LLTERRRAVFFGRFVSVLRETIAWVAGLAGMSWPRFLFWNPFGGIVWASGIGLLAYFGGKASPTQSSRHGLYAGAKGLHTYRTLRIVQVEQRRSPVLRGFCRAL